MCNTGMMERRHINSLLELLSEGYSEEEIVQYIRLIKADIEEIEVEDPCTIRKRKE